jgi:hypothetical protein
MTIYQRFGAHCAVAFIAFSTAWLAVHDDFRHFVWDVPGQSGWTRDVTLPLPWVPPYSCLYRDALGWTHFWAPRRLRIDDQGPKAPPFYVTVDCESAEDPGDVP